MSTKLGERFARTVAAKDAGGLEGLLTSAVNFRALTPGRAWEGDDPEAVVEVILGSWFPPDCSITEVLAVDCANVGPVDRLSYRFGAEWPDGAFVIEQQAYLKTEGDRICWLRILCSGFVRDE